ncbi:MAG: molecular chaperone HtpG [Proteobacteria bacterium]|nr:molecular chaperone HtpG [Pseudomonadota bacterium]
METHHFQADAQQILKLVTHSIYSDKEVFLRELLSNASDALDKARFLSMQNEDLRGVDEPSIRVSLDEENHTITIEDDGVGMTREEVIENLGTIAQSGTKSFSEKLNNAESIESLIGQFGVGFYSAFMVAEKVVVESLSMQNDAAPIIWESEGGASFSLSEGSKEERGTRITLHINKDDAENFCNDYQIKQIIKKHSEFIQWPIVMEEERINQEKALWLRNPSDITEEEYNTFYKHITRNWDEPLCTIHVKGEGISEYNAILFIPKKHSFQLDNTGAGYKVDLKLYQKRIKVLDHANDLLPQWLRFVSGVVDSSDIQLNVSRELLQKTPIVKAIQRKLISKILSKLEDLAKEQPEEYIAFWNDMGHILKEGLHDSTPKQEKALFNLFRCRTTKSNGELRTLPEIKEDRQEGQEEIWFLTDLDKDRIGSRPILEGFKKRELEVMLLSDPVDEFVMMYKNQYDEVPFKSVAHGDLPEDEENETDEEKSDRAKANMLIDWLGDLLDDKVSEVRVSNRLTNSPSVLVSQEGALSANMEAILRAHNQDLPDTKRVLEINPSHPMVKTLARLNSDGKTELDTFAHLLFDHASIADGKLEDPTGFAERLQALMEKAATNL